jgi:hypothetical protein
LSREEAITAFAELHRDDPAALATQWVDIGAIVVQAGVTTAQQIALPAEWHR